MKKEAEQSDLQLFKVFGRDEDSVCACAVDGRQSFSDPIVCLCDFIGSSFRRVGLP